MTDRQHRLTPPLDQVYTWWEEACKRPPSSFYDKLDHVAVRAAAWGWQQRDASVAEELQAARCGWQQRDASVPSKLQKARDEELEACCEWVEAYAECGDALRAARRPRPKSLAEEALEALEVEDDAWPVKNREKGERFDIIRRALERLQELEGQG